MTKTMHRQLVSLISTAALALCLGAGCGGDGGDGGADAAGEPDAVAATPREVFDADVRPLLDAKCASCHAPAGSSYDWMYAADGNVYNAVLAWPGLVDLAAPASSTLLTKGSHAGSAWAADEASTILAWIELEAQNQ